MDKATADHIDRLCRAGFTYEVKEFNLLHWRSHRDAVLNNEPWSGPCGDLTSTVLDMLTRPAPDSKDRQPAALQDCYRLLVSIYGSATPDHIIGCVHTSDAGYVIVGDTTRPGAYTHNAVSHRGLEFNRLSEVDAGDPTWRQGVPW